MKKFIFCIFMMFNGLLANAQINFTPYTIYPVGNNCWNCPSSGIDYVDSGDIDADGDIDIVGLSDWHPTNDMFIWINNNGINQPIVIPTLTPSGPRAIDIANIDGIPGDEIILCTGLAVEIWKYYGNSICTKVYSQNTGQGLDGVSVGDLDSDGYQDIGISHWNSPWITVLYGKERITRQLVFDRRDYPMSNAGYDQILIDRLGKEKKNSLIYMRGQTYQPNIEVLKIDVLRNISSQKTLQCQISPFSALNLTHGIAVGSPNGLGRKLSMTLGNMPYSFVATTDVSLFPTYSTSILTNGTSVDDMPEAIRYANVDGIIGDELVVLHGGQKLSVIQNNGTITQFNLPYATHYKPTSLTIGDFNNDGKKDIALANYNHGLVILYNSTTSIGSITMASSKVSQDIDISNFAVYPNPTSDILKIQSQKEIDLIELYDINGRRLKSANSLEMDLSDQPQGEYFLVGITKDGEKFSKKVIKK